jgi:hypothetical protein
MARKVIKAIETEFEGYKFRSRIEARWALFFSTARVAYEYEKEGYDLEDLGWYLPDFWLPADQAWVEIKGPPPTSMEINKLARLANYTQCRAALIFYGSIPNPINFRRSWRVVNCMQTNVPIMTGLSDAVIRHALGRARAARF